MQKTKQKNAMWVKTEDSALFEEAYFLLKEKAAPLGDSEMVKEANRIIAAFESGGPNLPFSISCQGWSVLCFFSDSPVFC